MMHPEIQPATSASRGRANRDGFALPMAILVIAFLTVTIAAAYAATSSELVTNSAQRGESRAYELAQGGLENFIARRNETVNGVNFCALCGLPPAVLYESTTVTLPGGYAQVVAQRLRAGSATRSAVYLLRSLGVDTSMSGVVTGSSSLAYAQRTVAQLVYWNVDQVNVLSGWTSTSGLNKKGSSGTISGADACTAAQGGGMPTVAGVAVPNGDYSATGNFTPVGNPPVQQLGTQAQANAAVKVDWNGIINGNRIQPDYTFQTSAAAGAGWPATANTTLYPVIRVNDNFSLPSSGGQGTLIVLGNLTMSGNNLWHGIILVGGQMVSNGNGTVSGAVMSGLNTLLSVQNPVTGVIDSTALMNARQLVTLPTTLALQPAAATANGTKTFDYNSCDVARAAGGLASYSVFPNAWMDNFVTY